ncbi:hypothetical protein C4588_01645 [Candidatus Parcubacteria bacterium]|nr:MAG: hypothetical protein C4588_01645 [Candidatus Parcubacteria bacterium]
MLLLLFLPVKLSLQKKVYLICWKSQESKQIWLATSPDLGILGVVDVYFKFSDCSEVWDTQRGYRVLLAELFDPVIIENALGRIKVSFIDKELFKKQVSTVWHYMCAHHGWSLPFNNLKKLWISTHLYARQNPHSRPHLAYHALTEDLCPDNLTIEFDLKQLSSRYQREMRSFVRVRTGMPIPEYITVNENYRRRGLATHLYLEMAKYLAKHYGLPLYASSLQSDEAKAVWESMSKNKKLPVRKVVKDGRRRFVLDYTTAVLVNSAE